MEADNSVDTAVAEEVICSRHNVAAVLAFGIAVAAELTAEEVDMRETGRVGVARQLDTRFAVEVASSRRMRTSELAGEVDKGSGMVERDRMVAEVQTNKVIAGVLSRTDSSAIVAAATIEMGEEHRGWTMSEKYTSNSSCTRIVGAVSLVGQMGIGCVVKGDSVVERSRMPREDY